MPVRLVQSVGNKKAPCRNRGLKERENMEEVKIMVNDFGTLFAVYPDGKVRTILVDVHDTQHYGILRIGAPVQLKGECK